jgi:FlaA1/EpsC-like NDP-sugar epimerase
MIDGWMGNVSVDALLGRETKAVYGPEAQLIIKGSTALVTGSGGSIGSEIVRQLLHLKAACVVCVDNDEYSLYLLERELRGAALLVDETIVLADIRDGPALDTVFATHKPDYVFHAAAYKQLPLLERAPAAALLTNALGTFNVVAACVAHGVRRFVNISTDKAADPTSVLGMSKRLAEMVVRQHVGRGTRVASVRFGNVLGSRGSFVETFVWQIANDLPVTVTDQAMTRYFMTISQAAGLVIEASVMADEGGTYVLDMGKRYAMVDLIHRFAELNGSGKPRVVYTGRRDGEKLDEVPHGALEIAVPTRHPSISSVWVDATHDASPEQIRMLCAAALRGAPAEELRTELARLVSGILPMTTSART